MPRSQYYSMAMEGVNQITDLAHEAFLLAQKSDMVGELSFETVFPEKVLKDLWGEVKGSDQSLAKRQAVMEKMWVGLER